MSIIPVFFMRSGHLFRTAISN